MANSVMSMISDHRIWTNSLANPRNARTWCPGLDSVVYACIARESRSAYVTKQAAQPAAVAIHVVIFIMLREQFRELSAKSTDYKPVSNRQRLFDPTTDSTSPSRSSKRAFVCVGVQTRPSPKFV